jgi:hypothetical protein
MAKQEHLVYAFPMKNREPDFRCAQTETPEQGDLNAVHHE